MRIRATVAAVSGALALSALIAPVAQADTSPQVKDGRTTAAERLAEAKDGSAVQSFAAAEVPVVEKVTVNGGKDVVVGKSTAVTFAVYVRASHSSGIDGESLYVDIWKGANPEYPDGWLLPNETTPTCTVQSATTSTCKLTFTAEPGTLDPFELYSNNLAGTWNVAPVVWANNYDAYGDDYGSTTRIKRMSAVTVNAAPEPVTKGKAITVTGKLTRASWVSKAYIGYSGQSVALQFRKAGTSTYTTLKTVKTNSTGNLSTTVTASADGYFRYTYAGNVTSSPATAAGDFIDVK